MKTAALPPAGLLAAFLLAGCSAPGSLPLLGPDGGPDAIAFGLDAGRPRCSDGLDDGDESDVDCGGSCGGCANGRRCGTDTDCQSRSCVAGVCAAVLCDNGQLDPGEGDVDCGGACIRCQDGRTCRVGDDCHSRHCRAGRCFTPSPVTVTFETDTYPLGDAPFNPVVADLDGDGRLDVAVALGGGVALLLGRGDGTLAPPALHRELGGMLHLAAGDLDRDGRADLAGSDGHDLAVAFSAPGAWSLVGPFPGFNGARGVAIGDADGDGWQDVTLAAVVLGGGQVFLGGPGRALTPGPTFPGRLAVPAALTVGAFAPHSGLDLVCTEDAHAYLYRGARQGILPIEGTIDILDVGLLANGVGHFDGDGTLDLVMTGADARLRVVLGDGMADFEPPRASEPDPVYLARRVVAADFDGDGWDDVATATLEEDAPLGHLAVWLGEDDGTFRMLPSSPLVTSRLAGLAVADLDGDGRPDLIVADEAAGALLVLRNTTQ